MSNNNNNATQKFINASSSSSNSSSSSSNSTTTSPAIQSLLVADEYNEPNKQNKRNEQHEPADSNKRKRDQNAVNDESDLWTDHQIEVLILLYAEYYRKTNDRARIRSPNRLQLDKKDLENFRRAFIEQTGVQRTEIDLTDKWEYLKQQYVEKYRYGRHSGIGYGPLPRIDSLIHDVVIDDPTVYPVATYDSLTRRLEVRKGASGSNPIVVDDEEGTLHPEPEKKRPRRALATRKSNMVERQETIFDRIRKINEESLHKLDEIMKKPVVVKIEGSEERQRSLDRLNNILEKFYDKLF